MKRAKLLILIILGTVLLYLPSVLTFFTHDDFFNLKISDVNSIFGFINFFNIFQPSPQHFGLYRPLTTQSFFFLGRSLLALNPIPLHLISLIFLCLNIFLCHELIKKLSKNNIESLIGAAIYGFSATHFGQVYFLSAFQELGLTFFCFLSILFFINFLDDKKLGTYILSFIFFSLALMSKETAVVLPFLITLTLIYFRSSFQTIVKWMWPYLILLFSYLYLHIFSYGLAVGDSYIWQISPKILNTLLWYLLWSLNIPEMLVDYIGPGIHVNLNLFRFYSSLIIPIMIVFIFEGGLFLYSLFKLKSQDIRFLVFGFIWFIISLLPLLFLPWHKFTYELGIPLLGVAMLAARVLSGIKKRIIIISFLTVWVTLSTLTNIITYQTSWITQGAKTSKAVDTFVRQNNIMNQTIYFYDTKLDQDLPWSPSKQLQTILSDQNYFDVFYSGKVKADYNSKSAYSGELMLRSRDFFK